MSDMQYDSERGMTMMSKLQNEVNSTVGNSGISYKIENTLAFPLLLWRASKPKISTTKLYGQNLF